MRIQREKFDPACHDWWRWMELWDAHAMELRSLKTRLHVDQYLRIQQDGRLVLMSLRDEDNILQGYSSHFWHQDLHFSLRVAQDDAWYVVPSLRNKGFGTMLRRAALDELRAEGVEIAYGRLKAAHPHDESMAELGYAPWETVFIKDLRRG